MNHATRPGGRSRAARPLTSRPSERLRTVAVRKRAKREQSARRSAGTARPCGTSSTSTCCTADSGPGRAPRNVDEVQRDRCRSPSCTAGSSDKSLPGPSIGHARAAATRSRAPRTGSSHRETSFGPEEDRHRRDCHPATLAVWRASAPAASTAWLRPTGCEVRPLGLAVELGARRTVALYHVDGDLACVARRRDEVAGGRNRTGPSVTPPR